MDDLEPQLRALRESYRARLPGLVDDLAGLVRAAQRSEAEPAATDAAERLAHRLKGTTGSYGFDAASAELAAIEAELAGVRRDDANREAAWKRIEATLDRLTRLLRDAGRSGVDPAPST